MINQILSLLFMALGGIAQGLAMEFMMEKKNEKTTTLIRLLHWTVVCFGGSYFNVFGGVIQETLHIRMLIHWIGVLSAVFLYYRQPLWQRLMAVILLFFAGGMAEIPTAIMVENINFDVAVAMDRTNSVSVLLVGWGAVLGSLSCMIVTVLWRKFFYRGSKMKYFGIIILGTANHWINFFIFMKSIWADNITKTIIWSVLIGVICVISWILIVFSESEKEEIQHRLAEVKRKAELEQLYYDDISKRRQLVSAIIQKNNREMSCVKHLLENNKVVEAESTLRKLSVDIEHTRDYKYCEIPVINAVLAEKQKDCEKKSIILNTEVSISESVSIGQMDLCCILGNLLDNAIRACQDVFLNNDKAGNTVQIELKVKEKGGFLIFKCTNPMTGKPISKGSGYGLKIIQGIVDDYNGDFQIQKEKNYFSAQVVLRNQKKGDLAE